MVGNHPIGNPTYTMHTMHTNAYKPFKNVTQRAGRHSEFMAADHCAPRYGVCSYDDIADNCAPEPDNCAPVCDIVYHIT